MDAWEWGRLGSHGSHCIPMGMGRRLAMGWKWDGKLGMGMNCMGMGMLKRTIN